MQTPWQAGKCSIWDVKVSQTTSMHVMVVCWRIVRRTARPSKHCITKIIGNSGKLVIERFGGDPVVDTCLLDVVLVQHGSFVIQTQTT